MNSKIVRLPHARWASLKLMAAALAALLLLPFLLLALLPMLIMFVPIAVVAIPVIAPVMLSGKLAARWELEQRSARSHAATPIKRAALTVNQP